MSHSKLGITKDLLATKVLPFLIPLSIDNNLNLSQVLTRIHVLWRIWFFLVQVKMYFYKHFIAVVVF